MARNPIDIDDYVLSDDEHAICAECANRHPTVEWNDEYIVQCTLWKHNVTGEFIDARVPRNTTDMCNGTLWEAPPEPKETILHKCLMASYRFGETIKRFVSWI